jgi:GNAT superfamily N-acetyltransferase
MEQIELREIRDFTIEQVLKLYHANKWTSAKDPKKLFDALMNSHSLVTAWDGGTLIGLGNAISDGSLVVYYPHLLVLPDYQRRGVGRRIMERLTSKYKNFHQQVLLATGPVEFYKKCGFDVATGTAMTYRK